MLNKNERVRILRKELGLTLEKFGEVFGVKKDAISKIENGRVNLTEQMSKAICREFHVSEDWLENGKGDMFLPQDRQEQLKAWASKALGERDDSFKWRFVSLLMSLPGEWWDVLEQKANEIFFSETGSVAPDVPDTNVGNMTAAVSDLAKRPDEMTREELHAELDRQLDFAEDSIKMESNGTA